MRQEKYKVKHDAVLKNTISSEVLECNIVNEVYIDDKGYWQVNVPSRGAAKLLYNKEAWILQKNR